MEEAEKMAALKKAYADIILNTAKEAAARIMVSERKALCFQKDLFCAKEEALSMLLRLKQMMDSKVTEAQITTLSQQRKIEELEAQLHEAEDIVRDLRAELKVVQDDLEMVKNNQVQREQIVKGGAASKEDTLQENKLHASEFIIFPPDWGSRPITTSDMKNISLNQRNTDNTCCNATTQTEPSSDSPTDNYYAGNPDLASIIMRNKEPELYRNGCTQRIRAFERNLLDGKLPLSGQRDDQHSHIMIETIIREDENGEGTCTVASPMADNMGVMEKNPIGLEEVMQHNSSCVKGKDVKFTRKRRRRRRLPLSGQRDDQHSHIMDGKLPLSGQRDDQHSHIMIETIIREDEKDEGTCTVASPKADNMGVMEKNPIGVEEVMQQNSSCVKGEDVKFTCKRRRRLPLSGQRDDQNSHIMIETIIREDEKGEDTCTVASPMADNMGVMEKNPIGLEEVMQHNSSCVKGEAVKLTRKRRRRRRTWSTKATSCRSLPDQVMNPCQSSVLSGSQTCPYSVNMNAESGEEPSKITENETRKDPESHLAPGLSSNTTDLDPLSGYADVTGSEVEAINAGSDQNNSNKDIVLMDKSVLTRQESEVAKSSGVPVCKLNLKTVDVPLMNSDLKNSKTSETINGTPTQTGLLKYTFRRKRKKESMSSPDENTSLEQNILKKTGEKQNDVPEPQKSSLIIESSRDSRRLVQVARQLISLSEKRWW
ncbi:hypothetical protein HHK36_015232 [Tetracentron sinense]|uniref:Uncharacterized protein n=1 Tax=Tetracentron sinense TaxID=13715 RepID=A0A834ZAQ6_TETSI|nr:hypothetical protein HHK36_015232 [Tetracentron sinense]